MDPIDATDAGDYKSCQYSGSSLDAQYRAALEISRRGELELVVPDTIEAISEEQCLPDPLPSRGRADVIARYAKLVNLFKQLRTSRVSNTEQSPSQTLPVHPGMYYKTKYDINIIIT